MTLPGFQLFCLENPSLARDLLSIVDSTDIQAVRDMYSYGAKIVEPYFNDLEGRPNHDVTSQPIGDATGTRG